MPVNNPRHSRFFWRSSAMFGILDFDRQFKEVNAAWEKTLGLSTGQLLAKRFLDFVHPEDQPSTQYYFDKINEGLASVSFSCRFRHHDGSYRLLLCEINGAASVEYAFYVVGMDITTREQPMVADEMISVLQEGVVLQYANGTIGACNPSAERILGLSADQMMGWTLVDPDWRLIHEDNSPFPAETHPAICTLRTGQSYADVIMGILKPDESVVWIRVNSYPLWRDDVTTPYAVVISFSDVTAFKETERSLRKETNNHSPAVAETNYDLWDWDLETSEVHFSPRWKLMLGFSEHELPNHIDTWLQRIHPADYKRVMGDIQSHIDSLTQICENTHRVQHKDGNYRWILHRSVMVRDSNGKPHRMIGTHLDVTEPRRVEEELQETEKKYRQLMDIESDALFLIDAETTDILDANKASTYLYGYSRNQLLKTKKIELSAQPDKTVKSMKKGMKYTSQQFHKKLDGTVFPVEVTAAPFVFKGRQVLTVAVRDITEQQKIETSLWESEAKYRQLFEASSIPTVVFDTNTQQFFDVNRAAIDLYGYSKEEFLRMTTEDVSAEPVKKRGAFSSGNKKVQVIPLRWHKKKDGSVFPVEISTGNSYLFQGRSLVCATIRDITERKAHEEALRKERDFINTLVQASPAFFFATNPDGKVRMMNKAMLSALEYTLEEVQDVDYLLTFVPETERPLVSNEFENLIKTMQPSLMESHVLAKSKRPLLVEWHSRAIVKANGALDYLFGVGIDVTERKKAQGHLRLFKSIIESSEEAIAIANPDGQLVYVNPAYEKLFGFSSKELKQLHQHEYYTKESQEIWETGIMPDLIKGNSWEGELSARDKNKSVFPVWQRADAIRDAGGNLLFSFILLHDISERQRMWETLRKQWEENQMIFNTVPAMIWYRDKDNHLLRANRLAVEMFGREDEQVSRLTDCEEIIHNERARYGLLESVVTASGGSRWLQIDKIPYRDNQGYIVGVIVFATDVTDYKQAETPSDTINKPYHLVVEYMPVLLHAFDPNGNILVWNRTSQAATGYNTDEILGNPKAVALLFPEEEERARMMMKWDDLDMGEDGQMCWETNIACKDGYLKRVIWRSICKQFPIPGWQGWHIGQIIGSQSPIEYLARNNENLLGTLLESSKIAVCITDDRGRFLQVNHTYADLYGYKAEELIGQPFTLTLPLETHSDAVREYYSLLMTHDDPTLLKQRSDIKRDGQPFDVQVLASRVVLEDRRRLLITFVTKTNSPPRRLPKMV